MISIYTGYVAILFSDRYLTTLACTDLSLQKNWIFFALGGKKKVESFVSAHTSLSRLVPAAVVGLSSGVYGLKRVLNTSAMPRTDLPIPDGLGWPHP